MTVTEAGRPGDGRASFARADGGVKDSGYGRFGGTESIREFTTVQLVTINHDQHCPL